jgi:hypothetical protein
MIPNDVYQLGYFHFVHGNRARCSIKDGKVVFSSERAHFSKDRKEDIKMGFIYVAGWTRAEEVEVYS